MEIKSEERLKEFDQILETKKQELNLDNQEFNGNNISFFRRLFFFGVRVGLGMCIEISHKRYLSGQ